MRKRVRAHDGLVRLNHHAGDFAHEPARTRELGRVDLRADAVEIVPHVERHDDLLERGVAGPLPNAVHGHFDLPRAVLHGRKAVRDG